MNAQELPTEEHQTETLNNVVETNPELSNKPDNEGEKLPQELQQKLEKLQEEIALLEAQKARIIQEQFTESQTTIARLLQDYLQELEQKKNSLQITVEQLERRRDRIQEEMRKNFAGVSQELAIRVQGFKDYLVGSLQDLAASAEELQLVKEQETIPTPETKVIPTSEPVKNQIQFSESSFQKTAKQIRSLLDQYRIKPDYYGPSWQLRRTFEPIHAERVSNWFFNMGGRGAIKTMGSRLQNILISSAIISILYELHGEDLRVLVLANSPERLGEWRRGLQDCLGITRGDFGPDRGVILFESAEALIVKCDRIVNDREIPLIIVDETEEQISLGLLQFPLWLAFAPNPQQMSMSSDFRF
jgi:signal transduction histidine kinase